VGYSDHTLGIEACVLAVALGARILEKHFTLSHDYSDFRDHQLSADPGELADLVTRVRRAETMIGVPRSGILPTEEAVAAAARRSIVAACDLSAGHALTEKDLNWLRPGDGLPPGHEKELLGHVLARDVARGEPLLRGDLADCTDTVPRS
jgi:sialic acid synthase SpsE